MSHTQVAVQTRSPWSGIKMGIGILLSLAGGLAQASSEANLVLPQLNDPQLAVFLGGFTGWALSVSNTFAPCPCITARMKLALSFIKPAKLI